MLCVAIVSLIVYISVERLLTTVSIIVYTKSIEKDITIESTQDHLNLIGPLSFDLRNSCTVLLYANLIKATFTIKASEIIIILLLFP